MKKLLTFLLTPLIALLLATQAIATEPCPEHFANGEAPQLTNQKMAAHTTTLCFSAYAVLHSGISRTPLWSAEHLTSDRIWKAEAMKRRNAFHAEKALDPEERAELADYAKSGHDRGHMSPSGDMPTAKAQKESFSLANMIPQNPNNNQNLWEGVETAMRTLTLKEGELYIVTGPIFEGDNLERLNQRVLIPSHVFKAIYDPVRQKAAAYIAPNQAGSKYETVSITELEQRVGINLFPTLSVQIKTDKMILPKPTPHAKSSKKKTQQQSRKVLF